MMYKIFIRQPWDTSWERWDPNKSYFFKWSAGFKVAELQQMNHVTDRTEFLISRSEP